MNNTLGIVLTGGKYQGLKDLSTIRAGSAVPVGGKYRAIDFVLSNMVNSNIKKVGVITQYSFRSLMDHLGSGKEWDLDRRYDGLFIFPPSLSDDDSGIYRGSADAMYKNLSFLKRSNEEYVIIAQGNCVYKTIYNSMLEYHIQKDADITIAYREMTDYNQIELTGLGIISINEDKRIIDLQEKPLNPMTKDASIGIYILKKECLIHLLEECVAHGNYDFVKDVLIKKLNVLKIYGYKFSGYWRNLSSISMYYRCNMELLDPKIRHELFVQNGKIYTKVKDETPAKYNDEANVKNSIIADGCIIEGTVENSILFRGVTVRKGSIIKDSIIMQSSFIGENVNIQYAILDKDVVISVGKHFRGDPELPTIIGKGTVV